MAPPPFSTVAQTGFSLAESYDQHRPTYNALAVTHLLNSLPAPLSKILEVGSGTGKFTTILSAHHANFSIHAVEPHSQMSAVLSSKNLPGVIVSSGSAYALPVEDGWADAVIAAQAFHWFATGVVLVEFSRALREGGGLGIIWNVEDYNQTRGHVAATAWEGQLRDLNWEFTTDGMARYKDARWRGAFEEAGETFELPLGEKEFREEVWLTREGLWKRINTLSNIANQSEERKEVLRVRFDGILDTAGDLVQNEKGEIAVHSTCHIVWTFKK